MHDINVLTVVTNQSYKDFVTNLQKEISNFLSDRPKKTNEAYFLNKNIDDNDSITPKYHEDIARGNSAVMPKDLLVY